MNAMRVCFLALCATHPLFLQHSAWAGNKQKPEGSKEVVVHGALISADLTDMTRNNCYCKIYTFKMQEGRTYQLDMVSTEFDSWLRLESPEGKRVAEDDDSGGNLNARIVYRAAKSGEYRIVATSFGPMMLGRFTLTVKDLGDNPKQEKKGTPNKNTPQSRNERDSRYIVEVDDIVRMSKAGVSNDVILRQLDLGLFFGECLEAGGYETADLSQGMKRWGVICPTVEDVIKMKERGVSDDLVLTLQNRFMELAPRIVRYIPNDRVRSQESTSH